MRILVLAINYFPERTSVAPFTTGLSEYLAAEGHAVHVITAFPHYPEWHIWKEYRGRITQSEARQGVQIRRVRHFIPWRASSLPQRLLHDFSFAIAALIAGLGTGKCDLVYCSSPPPALALAAYVVGRIRRAPYVIKLTDLASAAAVSTGILREGVLLSWAQAVEGFAYRHAHTVVCLCEGFRDKLTQVGLPPNRLALIPDWGDTEAIRPVPKSGSFRTAHGIGAEEFVILHSGNMGKKQDLLNVVRAAELTSTNTSIRWVIVGEGEERSIIEGAIKARNLVNLLLLPLQPAASLCEMYADADILLLNQRATVREAVIPSKLLTYMASGKPVLCAADPCSETARLIREAECGHLVEPENPSALVEAAVALQSSASLRRLMGARGRTYVEMNYSKERVLGLYEQLVASFSRQQPTPVLITAE